MMVVDYFHQRTKIVSAKACVNALDGIYCSKTAVKGPIPVRGSQFPLKASNSVEFCRILPSNSVKFSKFWLQILAEFCRILNSGFKFCRILLNSDFPIKGNLMNIKIHISEIQRMKCSRPVSTPTWCPPTGRERRTGSVRPHEPIMRNHVWRHKTFATF